MSHNPSSDFASRFKNKISVVQRNGTQAKASELDSVNAPANPRRHQSAKATGGAQTKHFGAKRKPVAKPTGYASILKRGKQTQNTSSAAVAPQRMATNAEQRSVKAPANYADVYQQQYEEQYDEEDDYDDPSPTHYHQRQENSVAQRPRHHSASPVVQSSALHKSTRSNASHGSSGEVIRHHLGAKEMRRILEDDDYIPDILDTETHLTQQKAARKRAQPRTEGINNRTQPTQQQNMYRKPHLRANGASKYGTQKETFMSGTQDSIEEELQRSFSPVNHHQAQRQHRQPPQQHYAQPQVDDSFEMYHPNGQHANQRHQMQALPPSNHSPPQQYQSRNTHDNRMDSQYYDQHYSAPPQQPEKVVATRKRHNPKAPAPAAKHQSVTSDSESIKKKRSQRVAEKPEKTEEEVEKAAFIEGSYAKAHRRKVEFQPYTMDDYKSMRMKTKGLEKLGGLGPDLENDVLKKRRQKQERMKNYAKLIMKENAEYLTNVPRPSPVDQAKLQPKKGAEKRERMKEFASQIPKPKIKRRNRDTASTGDSKHTQDDTRSETSMTRDHGDEDQEPELSELELLEMQHKQDQDWMKDQFGDEYGGASDE